MKKYLFLAALAASVSFFGCSDDDEPTGGTTGDPVTDAISADVNKVVIPSYEALHDKGDALGDVLATLKASPSEANLAAAKTAWIDARKAWEACEAFGFGPVSDNSIDPDVDTWPFDSIAFHRILDSSVTLTQEFVTNMETTVKGFHAIEYLLFGSNTNKPFSAFTAREYEMLAALGENVSSRLHELAEAWSSSGGNYGKTVINNPSKSAALSEFAGSITDCATEVGEEKIGIPITSHDPNDDESRYSKNSTNDFANNIIGIRNIYLGTTDGSTGNGLTGIIKKNNAALDDSVKTAITTAITKINAMTPTFFDALNSNPTSVEQAQAAVLVLRDLLQNRVTPILAAQ